MLSLTPQAHPTRWQGGATYDSATKAYQSLSDFYVFRLGDPYYRFCSATGSGLKNAIAGQTAYFLLQCRDAFLNPADGASWSVAISGEIGMTPQPTALGSGEYKCEYTAVKAGNYKLGIKVGRLGVVDMIAGKDSNPDNYVHEFQGPDDPSNVKEYDLKVSPGVTSHLASTSTGDFITLSTAGVVGTFAITANDAFGNRRPGGDSISSIMELYDQASKRTFTGIEPVTGNVGDNSDGSYTVSYGITRAGMYRLQIQFSGTTGAGSPVFLQVKSAIADISKTYVYGQLLTVDAGFPSLIYVQTRDSFGNNIITEPIDDFPLGTEVIEFELCLSVPDDSYYSPDTCGGGEEELAVGKVVTYNVGPDGLSVNAKTGTPYYGLYLITMNPFNPNKFIPRVSQPPFAPSQRSLDSGYRQFPWHSMFPPFVWIARMLVALPEAFPDT